MTRIALLGMAPLPFEAAVRHHAPGIRSWQLARPLLRAGHRVRLFLCRYPEAYTGDYAARERLPCPEGEGTIELFTPECFASADLAEALAAEPIDLLVGASVKPSGRAAELAGDRPLWVDLFGHTIAEGQAKAAHHGRDDLLLDYFKVQARLLVRGDAFSAVSWAQELALVGELGLAGRLNSRTAPHRFTHVIPCGAWEPIERSIPPLLRGVRLPDSAFVALWSGGYNTWADVETLMAGLERAMDAAPDLHFVSTGGELEGQDHATYAGFHSRVAQSRHRDRFHLLGWVSAEVAAACCREADVGLNVDRDIWESRLGSRNRIPTMLSYGLTVVSSRVSEVSIYAEEAGLGHTFPAGDSVAFAALLTDLAGRPGMLRQQRERVARTALLDLAFEATAVPLVAYAGSPARAPDADLPNELGAKLMESAAALDSKDALIDELQTRIKEGGAHVGNLEALIAEKDRALQDLRSFEQKVKASLPYRIYVRLRGA